MKIVADQAIPYINLLFPSIGDVALYDGREIASDHLHDADVLVVRTVTRVNRELLEGSAVKFVATATSGYDHIDTEYLREHQIGFAHAPGCNARSVAEYVLSSLFVLADQRDFDLTEKSVGIIGCGNAGSTVLSLLETLGVACRVYDPPLQEAGARFPFHTIDEVLNSDIITLHVPLTLAGPWPTRNMVDKEFLSRIRSDVILINTSRGGIVDEHDLEFFTEYAPSCSIVLDVWQDEPSINTALLRKTAISTPHIAGYSADAKVRGTWAVYKQVCRYFHRPYNDFPLPVLPESRINRIAISEYTGEIDAVQMAVLAGYDVRTDSASLRHMLILGKDERGAFFSGLRNNYPVRREFAAMTVSVPEHARSLQNKLAKLGFRVA